MEKTRYGIIVKTNLGIEEAEEKIRASLAEEGFGILTEIDVAATLKKKLDIDRPFYKILGACNPGLANQALGAEEAIGLLLPCNVAVYESEAGGAVVAALDPGTMSELTDNQELDPVSSEARTRIERALSAIEG